MQNLPEATDRKKGWCRPADQRRKIILFQQWPAKWHLISQLLAEANVAALRRQIGLFFH